MIFTKSCMLKFIEIFEGDNVWVSVGTPHAGLRVSTNLSNGQVLSTTVMDCYIGLSMCRNPETEKQYDEFLNKCKILQDYLNEDYT